MPIPSSELILNPDGSVYHLNLRPEELATKIITVGDPERVSKISKYFDSIEVVKQKREFVIHTGHYKGNRITVISTGMGTDNIEIVLTELDALVNINLETREIKKELTTLEIVRIGTSGCLQPEIEIDTQLASRDAIGLDTLMQFYKLPQSPSEVATVEKLKEHLGLLFTPYVVSANDELLKRIGFDMIQGTTITCPGFYAPQARVLRLETVINEYISKLFSFRNEENQPITNFEMETAGIYSMAKLLGHKALSISAIVAHRVHNTFSLQAENTIDQIALKVLDRI
jgi:uridine phosphorylase